MPGSPSNSSCWNTWRRWIPNGRWAISTSWPKRNASPRAERAGRRLPRERRSVPLRASAGWRTGGPIAAWVQPPERLAARDGRLWAAPASGQAARSQNDVVRVRRAGAGGHRAGPGLVDLDTPSVIDQRGDIGGTDVIVGV